MRLAKDNMMLVKIIGNYNYVFTMKMKKKLCRDFAEKREPYIVVMVLSRKRRCLALIGACFASSFSCSRHYTCIVYK